MNIKVFPIIRSLLSYVLPESIMKRPGSGGTVSAEYCYSVWLRHLVSLKQSGILINTDKIKRIGEFGPGDSLGIGICALFTGGDSYYGFDVIEHANTIKNIEISEKLFDLFGNKAKIPTGNKLNSVYPKLKNYEFPRDIINKEYYSSNRLKEKLKEIKEALNGGKSKTSINYVVPWDKSEILDVCSLDIVFSQAVMEHVTELEQAYGKMFEWLKPKGIITHVIDFRTHEMTKEWNGHLYITNRMWKFLMHGRKYPINRIPLATHISILEKIGFKIINISREKKRNEFNFDPPAWINMRYDADDLDTSSALIQAIKPT